MAGKSKKTKVVPLHAKDKNGKIISTYYVSKNTTIKEKLQLLKYSRKTRQKELHVEGKVQKSS